MAFTRMADTPRAYKHTQTNIVMHEVWTIQELVKMNGVMFDHSDGSWMWMAGRDLINFIRESAATNLVELAEFAKNKIVVANGAFGRVGSTFFRPRPIMQWTNPSINVPKLFGIVTSVARGMGCSPDRMSSKGNSTYFSTATGAHGGVHIHAFKYAILPAAFNGIGVATLRIPSTLSWAGMIESMIASLPNADIAEVKQKYDEATVKLKAMIGATNITQRVTVPLSGVVQSGGEFLHKPYTDTFGTTKIQGTFPGGSNDTMVRFLYTDTSQEHEGDSAASSGLGQTMLSLARYSYTIPFLWESGAAPIDGKGVGYSTEKISYATIDGRNIRTILGGISGGAIHGYLADKLGYVFAGEDLNSQAYFDRYVSRIRIGDDGIRASSVPQQGVQTFEAYNSALETSYNNNTVSTQGIDSDVWPPGATAFFNPAHLISVIPEAIKGGGSTVNEVFGQYGEFLTQDFSFSAAAGHQTNVLAPIAGTFDISQISVARG